MGAFIPAILLGSAGALVTYLYLADERRRMREPGPPPGCQACLAGRRAVPRSAVEAWRTRDGGEAAYLPVKLAIPGDWRDCGQDPSLVHPPKDFARKLRQLGEPV